MAEITVEIHGLDQSIYFEGKRIQDLKESIKKLLEGTLYKDAKVISAECRKEEGNGDWWLHVVGHYSVCKHASDLLRPLENMYPRLPSQTFARGSLLFTPGSTYELAVPSPWISGSHELSMLPAHSPMQAIVRRFEQAKAGFPDT